MPDRSFRPAGSAVAGVLGVLLGVAVLLTLLDRPAGAVAMAAAGTAVVGVLVLTRGLGHAPGLPRPPDPGRTGTRYTISQLSAGMTGRDGRVRSQVVNRLHSVATTRLALNGLSLDDPADRTAVRDLLGDPAAHVLLGGGPPPTEAEVSRCLDALDALTPRTPTRRNR